MGLDIGSNKYLYNTYGFEADASKTFTNLRQGEWFLQSEFDVMLYAEVKTHARALLYI